MTVSASIYSCEINPFDWSDVNVLITPPALHVLLLFLSHFGFFFPSLLLLSVGRLLSFVSSLLSLSRFLSSLSLSPSAHRCRRATRQRVMGLKVCIPITEKRIVVHSRVIAPGRSVARD